MTPLPLSGSSLLVALLADPVDHVRSPAFLDPQFAAQGIDAHVIPLHVHLKDLEAAFAGLRLMHNVVGAILTMPHKQKAAQLCTEVSARGKLAGAVNIVRFGKDGGLSGDMVDGVGLLRAMALEKVEVRGRKVLLLGAGGVARAISAAFIEAGVAAISIANIDRRQGEALATAVRAAAPKVAVDVVAWPALPAGFDVVVNATSLGLHEGDPPPLDPALLKPPMDVIEVNGPVEWTAFREGARRAGCRTVGGRQMSDQQIDAFIDFFEIRAPRSASHG
jgi:shikimate dehydrogenase